MERALLDGLIPHSLEWQLVAEVAAAEHEQWWKLDPAVDVAWRRAATSLERKGFIDRAYMPINGRRRSVAVRFKAATSADSDAFATDAVQRAVDKLMDYQGEVAFTHGMVFAFTRWTGATTADDALRAAHLVPRDDMLRAPTGSDRLYPDFEPVRIAAQSLVRLSNWVTGEDGLMLELTWLDDFLRAAASDDPQLAMDALVDDMATTAKAWFWGELDLSQRDELVAQLRSHQGMGRRGKPPEDVRDIVRSRLFDGTNKDLPLGYHDLSANLSRSTRWGRDIFIRHR